MKKKIIIFILVIVMMLAMSVTVYADDVEDYIITNLASGYSLYTGSTIWKSNYDSYTYDDNDYIRNKSYGYATSYTSRLYYGSSKAANYLSVSDGQMKGTNIWTTVPAIGSYRYKFHNQNVYAIIAKGDCGVS